METLREIHDLFWGSKTIIVFYMFCIALIIFYKDKRKKVLIASALFPLCCLFLFIYNPLISKVEGNANYGIFEHVRFYLLPMIPITIGYVLTCILSKAVNKGKVKEASVALSICILFLVFGQQFTSYKFPDNIYKIDSEAIEVCDLIQHNDQDVHVYTVGVGISGDRDNNLIESIRQYNYKIKFLSQSTYSVDINDPNYYSKWLSILKTFNEDYDYLIARKSDTSILETFGLEVYGVTENYVIMTKGQIENYEVYIG